MFLALGRAEGGVQEIRPGSHVGKADLLGFLKNRIPWDLKHKMDL